MTMVNRCDCCCVCGAFCSNDPYCGRDMWFTATYSGASNGSNGFCSNCATDLNVSFSIDNTNASTSVDAATWNVSRPAYTSHDAKDGTRVCSWMGAAAGDITSFCSTGAAFINSAAIEVYQGTDDKWRMVYVVGWGDASGYYCLLAGESLLGGTGDAVDCGDPGEGTPTFSLNISLTRYDEVGVDGGYCTPPTSVLIEGDPQ